MWFVWAAIPSKGPDAVDTANAFAIIPKLRFEEGMNTPAICEYFETLGFFARQMWDWTWVRFTDGAGWRDHVGFYIECLNRIQTCCRQSRRCKAVSNHSKWSKNCILGWVSEFLLHVPSQRNARMTTGLDVWDAWSFFKLLDMDRGKELCVHQAWISCLILAGAQDAQVISLVLQYAIQYLLVRSC